MKMKQIQTKETIIATNPDWLNCDILPDDINSTQFVTFKINFSWFAYFCWCNHILAVLEQVQCHLFLMAIKIIAVLTNQTVAVHIQTKSWIVSSMVTYKTSLEHKAVDCYMQEKKENFAE